MTAKVAIHTLGCRANQYDSDSLQSKLASMGFSVVGFEKAADCYLVNTCTVTADADSEARRFIRKAHRQNPDAKIIVTGCYAQMAQSEIAKIEGVTHVVGNSRKEEIVREMQNLAAIGYHEVVLTGIHIGSYGRELSPKTDLYSLMRLIEKTRPVEQVRLSTLDPDEVSKEMIDLMAASAIFSPHLHIAIQNGDDAILRKMRRRHTTRELIALTGYASQKIADLGLGADIITGFPEETEKEHQTTKNLLQELPLTYLHVFPYSERKGTAAAGYDGSVPVPARKGRPLELIALGAQKKEKFWKTQIGKTRRFIVEERGGTTDNFIPLWIAKTGLQKGSGGFVVLENIEKGRMVGKWTSQPMKKSA